MSTKTVLYFYQAGHFPNPGKSGADRVFFVNVNALKQAGYDPVHVEVGPSIAARSGGEDEFIQLQEQQPEIQSSHWKYQSKRWLQPVFNPGQHNYAGFLNTYPFESIAALIDKYQPGLLFCENLRTFLLFAGFRTKIRKVICIHDLDYVMNYGKNQDRLLLSNSNPLVKLLKRVQIRLQYQAEKAFTFKHLNRADMVCVISQNDLHSLEKLKSAIVHVNCPVTVIPTEQQLELIKAKHAVEKQKQVKIIHVGKMSASHNRKAILWFLDNCWPQLKQIDTRYDYEIHFIGSQEGFGDQILKYKDETKLKFRGFVENLAEELIDASFMIVPPGYPTGVRTKIPEALAWGLPVITGYHDAYGAGIPKGDSRVLIADSSKAYVACCVRLINHAEQVAEMGKTALATWRQQWGQEIVTNHISRRLRTLAEVG